MDIKANRMDILRQVETGELTLEEAARWLAALDTVNANGASLSTLQPEPKLEGEPAAVWAQVPAAIVPWPAAEPLPTPAAVVISEFPGSDEPASAQPDRPRPPTWRGWWLLVFVPGLLLVLAAVNGMYAGFLAAGLGWGFWLSFFPFALGVVMLWLGWEIHQARWLYLRVRQRPGARPHELILSFPLPIGLLSWGIRRFDRFSAAGRGTQVGDLLQELNQSVTNDGAIHIFVGDPGGAQVEIWIDGPRGA